MRILIAVSSIGLGHAARARLVGRLLSEAGARVAFWAPGRAGRFLEAWGFQVYGLDAPDLSLPAEESYARFGDGGIGLYYVYRQWRLLGRGARSLLQAISEYDPDAVYVDESWEAMSVADKLPRPRFWASDFPLATWSRGPGQILASILTNRFIMRRLHLFDDRLYLGLEWEGPLAERKAYWALGPRIRDVLKQYTMIGPVPPVAPDEIYPEDKARKEIGAPRGEPLVLVQGGGTRVHTRRLAMAARDLARAGYTVYTTIPGVEGTRHIQGPMLPRLVKAFDCVYTHAGLSTITLLALTGVPGVLDPAQNHFEQLHNAAQAPRIWPWLVEALEDPLDDCRRVLSMRGKGDTKIYKNILKIKNIILGRLK